MVLRQLDCLLIFQFGLFNFICYCIVARADHEHSNDTETFTWKPSQHSMLMNETVQKIEEVIDDSGRIAGIIIGVLCGLCLVLALVGFCVYKQYLGRNVTSMNFDNPVYRKTTEDQFSLEKNQYQPARSYPSSLEPLTSPGTNEFV